MGDMDDLIRFRLAVAALRTLYERAKKVDDCYDPDSSGMYKSPEWERALKEAAEVLEEVSG